MSDNAAAADDAAQFVLLVSPHPWTHPHPVNDHVADLADGLMALVRARERVPRPIVVAPAADVRLRRHTRQAVRDLARGVPAAEVYARDELRAPAPGERKPVDGAHDWPLLATHMPVGPASVGLRASLRVVLDNSAITMVHVNDPLENALSRFLIRRWTGLTAATVHAVPASSALALVTSSTRERVLDSVDRWVVGSDSTRTKLVAMLGDVPVDPHVVDLRAARHRESGGGTGPSIVVGRAPDDDVYVRGIVRALTPLLDAHPELTVTFMSRWGAHHRPPVPRGMRGRIFSVDAPTRDEADAVYAGAGAYLAMPGADARACDEARAARLPIIDVPTMDDIDARDVEALQVRVLEAIDAVGERGGLPSVETIAAAYIKAWDDTRSRIHPHIARPTAGERNCVIDLHMHTSHSWDCATDPEALLYVAKQVGLTAVAVTDHNEISGALACAALAEEYGIQVIVGEEVKTSQGEVIGLFLTERIEPGLSWHETIEQIRAQDGLVYVPHPFDRLHTIPDVHLLRDTLDEIDAFESYNARLAFEQYNRDAERFARKYNLVEGAGSDAHVVQGLGTAAVHMPEWDDKESFLVALSQGEILKRPKSLLYLQGLKWVNDFTGRSKRLPAEAVGRERS